MKHLSKILRCFSILISKFNELYLAETKTLYHKTSCPFIRLVKVHLKAKSEELNGGKVQQKNSSRNKKFTL